MCVHDARCIMHAMIKTVNKKEREREINFNKKVFTNLKTVFCLFTFVLRVLRMYICKIRHKRYRGERVFLEFLIDYREMMEMCVCVCVCLFSFLTRSTHRFLYLIYRHILAFFIKSLYYYYFIYYVIIIQ